MGSAERTRNVPLLTAIVAAVIGVVLAAINAWVAPLPGVRALESVSIDARFRLRGPRAPASDRVVIVGIDDETYDVANDVLQTRRGYARLIDALNGYAPKVIAMDMLFASPEIVLAPDLADRVRALATKGSADPEMQAVLTDIVEELRGDELLAAAVKRSGRVMLGAMFFLGGKVDAGAREPTSFKSMRHGEVVDAGGGGYLRPANAKGYSASLDSLAAGSIGTGILNRYPDDDGVVRRMPLAVEYAGRHYMPLGMAVALAELGRKGDTRYVIGESEMMVAGRTIPVTLGSALMLDILGAKKVPTYSAADVLSGKLERGKLEGKLVFVGFTYAASDKVTTPLDRVADGVELHATVAENIISGRMLASARPWSSVAATGLLCALACLVQLRRIRRRPWVPPLVALAGIAAYAVLAMAWFAGGTVIAVAAPITLAIAVVIAAMISGLATEGREKAKLRAVFSQYVAGPVVDRILADPARAKLGGERKELTVLFSDIRGFSMFSEGMTPESLAAFLGEYLTPMTELVLESGGTLDKYIGDAVMAIWGAPIDVPDHAARACDVALKMQAALVGLNRTWSKQGKPAVAIGVGINTGAMAVGNMGSAARFDYTVLGDQVNLGARLEALTKEYGVDVLVGESTARAAAASFVFREIDVVRVKGRAGALPVFELIGRVGEAAPDTAFAAALAMYRKREFEAARAAFAALGDDPVATTMTERCAILAAAPLDETWDGVYEQQSK